MKVCDEEDTSALASWSHYADDRQTVVQYKL